MCEECRLLKIVSKSLHPRRLVAGKVRIGSWFLTGTAFGIGSRFFPEQPNIKLLN